MSKPWSAYRAEILADPELLERYRQTRRELRAWVEAKGGDPNESEVNIVYADGNKINMLGPEADL